MIFNVVLERRAQEGLGLAIKRGCSGEWASCGALVVDILPNGPAFGKLRQVQQQIFSLLHPVCFQRCTKCSYLSVSPMAQ